MRFYTRFNEQQTNGLNPLKNLLLDYSAYMQVAQIAQLLTRPAHYISRDFGDYYCGFEDNFSHFWGKVVSNLKSEI